MAFYYSKEDDLQVSDPVCLVPGEPGSVKKATPEALMVARAVLGIVLDIIVPDPEDPSRLVAQVGEAGNIPATSWNPDRPGEGPRITGDEPLLVARDSSCLRVATPLSGDYVIGIVEDDGTLVIQRDYELSLATHRMINVRDFGATGDGRTDDSPAFEAALAALPPHPVGSTGTTVFIPPGEYRLIRDLEIKRDIHLLGAGGIAGNTGVILHFDEGCGIVVHSHFSTPQSGQWGSGCVIEGLMLKGTLPGSRVRETPATRWQPETRYDIGSRVHMFQTNPREWLPHHRYQPGEKVRPIGRWDMVFQVHPTSRPPTMDESALRSGGTQPVWDSRIDIPDVGMVVEDNGIRWVEEFPEWQSGYQYRVGDKIRPVGRGDLICQVIATSPGARSGDTEPSWDTFPFVPDVGWIVDEIADEDFIRWSLQDDAMVEIQGYRYFYWECVRAGESGPRIPEIAAEIGGSKFLFTADKGSIIDLSREWEPDTDYHVGQVIRPPGRFDVVYVFLRSDDDARAPVGTSSGSWDADWDAQALIRDNDITWWRQDASPYFYEEGSERPVWRARVHAGIRMHTGCVVRNCWIQGFLNAGIWIYGGGYYPGGNANGWMVQQCLIGESGTGIFVLGTDAHQGTAINVTCTHIGRISGLEPREIDWLPKDRGGNGGIAFCDLSYFGNQYISCIAEENSDRGLVMEGTHNQSGTVIKFWDEGNKNGVFLSGSTILIGGVFVSGKDPRGIHTRVAMRDFRQLEEVNEKAPRRTRAMLHMQGADNVFLWNANRAGGPNSEYLNTIGWRYLPSGYMDPTYPYNIYLGHTWPPPTEWAFSYQANSPSYYFTIQDGFGPLGIAWRDPSGHFRGVGPAYGHDEAYFLGVSRNSERDNNIRRGFRRSGDRFEPPTGPLVRGRFLGRIVTRDGFRGKDHWAAGVQYWAFRDSAGWAPSTLEVDGYVFVCTRSGVSGGTAPDFSMAIRNRRESENPLSPILTKGLILSSWIPNSIQQPGMIKRANRRNPDDGHYYIYVCTGVEGSGATGTVEPSWPASTVNGEDQVTEEAWFNGDAYRKPYIISRVTWKCLGPDPDDACIVDEPGGPQWTCVGPIASFAEYDPVYEQGEGVANHADEILLDEYLVNLYTCAQFDIVVTAMSFGSSPSQAAAFTLRAAYYNNGSTLVRIGEDEVDRRATHDSMNAELRLEGFSMRLYVRGIEGVPLHWRSLRRPHKDAERLG